MITKLNAAHQTYNIQYWSDGFFSIDSDGYLVLGDKVSSSNIRLQEVVDNCIAQHPELTLPILLRFPGILQERLSQLVDSFEKAFINNQYNGDYLPAYPIKVNQMRSVLEGFLENGVGNKIALEAGSKPELFTILALAAKHDLTVICNGYKDRDYIRLALLGQRLGLEVNIIVEKLSELDLILSEAKNLNVKPRLGVRVRLSSLGKGKWQNTGGVKSKFGLTSLQLLSFLEKLKIENKLDYLKVLHFHLGSQISDLRDISVGLKEGARLYAEISRAGAELEAIDVGGGLGVDYEGTSSRSYYSINYNLESYANTVVKNIKEICDAEGLKHPRIITESGRAMVAHHAVLITNIIDFEPVVPKSINNYLEHNNLDFINELNNCLSSLDNNKRQSLEIYYQAKMNYEHAQELYINGEIHLPIRAEAEQIYYKICLKLIHILDPKVQNHRELLDKLNEDMANKVFCNFSLFQSLPDIWGIKQIFPIVPLKDLDKLDIGSRDTRGIIQDMTCDSDGRIDKYIDGQGVENSLPLPEFNPEDPYYLGFFLVGAYQEILGDLHNLFGDTATVDVKINKDKFILDNYNSASNIKDLIKYVDYDDKVLLENLFNKYKSIERDFAKQKNVFDFLKDYINKSPYYT